MKLRIAESLILPAEAVTETFALLGARGSGKTNGSRVLAEEMFRADLPFVVVDPVGAWHGLRSSRDGKSEGLAVTILGGEYGDEPIDERAGEAVADFVVTQRPFLVIDLSAFPSEATKKRFLLSFAVRLYHKNREALHLFLEEADDYIPQRMRGGGDEKSIEPQLLRAFENIVRRGRARGLGMTMITQRSAVLNKNVLTQAQTLIAFRTTGPQDRDAIEEWVKYHGQAKEIVASLAGLKDGEAWVWSPDFLRKTVRTRFRLSETFDSGRTPKPGEARQQPRARADVDLAGVRTAMAQTIERAKAEDPKALQLRIRELERELAKKPAPVVERVEVPVLGKDALGGLYCVIDDLRHLADVLTEGASRAAQTASVAAREIATAVTKATQPAPAPARTNEHQPAPARTGMRQHAPAVANGPVGSAEVGTGGLRRMLVALAQRPQGLSTSGLGIRAGLSSKSGTFDTYLSRARKAGWIDGARDRLTITDTGLAALGRYDPLPEGSALLAYWLGELGNSGAARILQALAAAYPKALSRAETAERAELTGTSGTFDTYLSRLRRLELIEGKGELRASEELFG